MHDHHKTELSEKTSQNHSHHTHSHENKTRIVALLTLVTMIAEIVFGYLTNSMALLADGWHMLTHTFAIGLSWFAYFITRKFANSTEISFSSSKVLALSGFSSAIILLFVAIFMAVESILRIISPQEIIFTDAILVAVIGLVVNILSAFLLHHEHEESDHTIKSAYLHVLADALTSVTAILALLAGLYFHLNSLDAISGILSSLVITKWAFGLIRDTGKDLIEFKRTQAF